MKALTMMSRVGMSRLMVVDESRLVGVITLKDLLKFLTKLSGEKVELEEGESVTRAEALARTVWKEALGYSVYADEEKEDGSVERAFVQYHAPDKTARAILFDYLLGKPKPHSAVKEEKVAIKKQENN